MTEQQESSNVEKDKECCGCISTEIKITLPYTSKGKEIFRNFCVKCYEKMKNGNLIIITESKRLVELNRLYSKRKPGRPPLLESEKRVKINTFINPEFMRFIQKEMEKVDVRGKRVFRGQGFVLEWLYAEWLKGGGGK